MKWYTLEERLPKKGDWVTFKLKDGEELDGLVDEGSIDQPQPCMCCAEPYFFKEIEAWLCEEDKE